MVDIVMFQSALSGLKTAADIALGIGKLNTMVEVQAKAIELQQILLSVQSSALNAQAEQFSLIQTIRELEKEVAEIKAWQAQKLRYKLVSPWDGTLVYALTQESAQSEPPHWLCTMCFEAGGKGFYSSQNKSNRLLLICDKCKGELQTQYRGGSVVFKYAEDISK